MPPRAARFTAPLCGLLAVVALALALVSPRATSACESPGNVPVELRARILADIAASQRAAQSAAESAESAEPPAHSRNTVAPGANPAQVGQWRVLAESAQILPVHSALLPTGKILYLQGSGNDHNYRLGINQARLFDPITEHVSGIGEFAGALVPAGDPPTLSDNDVFCSGHSLLADGRLLVVGGNLEYPTGWVHRVPMVQADLNHSAPGFDHPLPYDNPWIQRPDCHGFLGLREAFLFDAVTGTWTHSAKMAHGRWYPSTLMLGDGHVLAVSGYDDVGADGCASVNNRTVENFDPATETWSDPVPFPEDWPNDTYPYLHLLPTGNVFLAGPTGQTRVFNPQSLATVGSLMPSNRGFRDTATSILLTLDPEEDYRARVLNVGGASLFSILGTNQAEIIDFSEASPAWRIVAPMAHRRMHEPSVLLPDGKVLIVGGSDISETLGRGVLEAEIFDPDTETWNSAAASTIERHYHSEAVLLPDGRVWVAGSNPNRPPGAPADSYDATTPGCSPFSGACHADDHDAHGNNELRMEIYSPAYLFRGPRPQIAAAPAVIKYGVAFSVQLGAGTTPASVARAVLVRLTTTTHGRNMDQRSIVLTPTAIPGSGGDSLGLLAPPTAPIAPPGYYMLFVLGTDGVPSVAHILRLDGADAGVCAGEPDLDADGISDRCDSIDARLTSARTTIRGGKSSTGASARLHMTGEAPTTEASALLDVGSGLALRIHDGADFDLRATLAAADCHACGNDCLQCRNPAATVRARLRSSKGAAGTKNSVRFAINARGLDASPLVAPLTATLTTAPAVFVEGIDWSASQTTCVTKDLHLTCRRDSALTRTRRGPTP